MPIRFFLGANTPKGFNSFYDDFTSRQKKVYIIKSGPGSGKSSFMKAVAKNLEQKNIEYIHCSGDANSLDGIYLPQQETAIVDGTSPHVIEPFCPIAVDEYLHLGAFTDVKAFRADNIEVRPLFSLHKQAYQRVYRCLNAMRSLEDDILSQILHPDCLEKIARRTKGIIQREMKQGENSVIYKRYLNAITPKGDKIFWETVDQLAERVYVVENGFGLSHFMLSPILLAAIQASQPVYACYNPLSCDERLEHLIFPDLKLAFVSVNESREYPGEYYRKIRLDATIPQELYQSVRLRIKLIKKTSRAIFQEACVALEDAKLIHDKIEDIYQPYVDFASIYELADKISSEI